MNKFISFGTGNGSDASTAATTESSNAVSPLLVFTCTLIIEPFGVTLTTTVHFKGSGEE